MGLSDQPFDITCPDCGAMLKIDPVTRAIIAHTPAPRKRTFEDFTDAARALREADARRDSIFAQSVDAQKNKDDLMAKRFCLLYTSSLSEGTRQSTSSHFGFGRRR